MAGHPAPFALTVRSPAKINLNLLVGPKREDGYHEICSLMQKISLYDRIHLLGPARRDTFTCPGHPELETPENLVLRARDLFFKTLGFRMPLNITLEKRIPVSAGLGGGSSNAAKVLGALNRIMGRPIPAPMLRRMAAALGFDCPFFLFPGAAWARGRGEILTKAQVPKGFLVLANPGIRLSTAWVYGNYRLTDGGKSFNFRMLKLNRAVRPRLVNDLESVVFNTFPELKKLKSRLISLGAGGALVSGSGPTVFGLFLTRKKAREARDQLRKERWPWVRVAGTL
jgi:4-diphosphocytidyl-2-C-methyl-D-erythritol kinase